MRIEKDEFLNDAGKFAVITMSRVTSCGCLPVCLIVRVPALRMENGFGYQHQNSVHIVVYGTQYMA